MAFCPNCGTKLNDGAKFCTNCGTPQTPVVPVQPVVQEEPATVQAPVQEYQTPVQEYQAPQQNYQAPVQEYQPPQQSYQAPVQEYQAPQQSYQAPVQEYQAPQQSYQAPVQEYQPPQQNYQTPQQNYQAPQGGKPPKAKKKVKPLAIILPIAGVVLVGIIVLLVVLLGGGKVDKNVYGKYDIVASAAYGYTADTDGEWVELKKGGKGTFFYGYEFKLKWKLTDNAFDGTVSFLGIEEDMDGTLENNLLTVTYGDYTMVFLKEGAELPADFKAPGAEFDITDMSDWDIREGDAGYYYIKSMETAGVTLDYDQLLAGEMTDAYLWLLSDGTGEIQLAAATEPVEITWEEGIIHYFDKDLVYTRNGDDITVDFTGGTTMTYSLNLPGWNDFDTGDGASTELDYDLIWALENDWHGIARFESCTGKYEGLNDTYMQLIARFTFQEDGTLVPYLRAYISASEDENFELDESCYVDYDAKAIVLNGQLVKKPFVYPAWFYYDESDQSINYYVTCAQGDDAMSFYGTLRLFGDDWSTEYYVTLPDGFEPSEFGDYSFEDMVELYGLDWSNVPELTHVGENGLGIATEGAPIGDDGGADDLYADWDKKLCDENATYDLKKMAEVYKWYMGLSYDESAALTYDDFCEKLGGKGKLFYDSTTPEELHLWWTDAAGSGYFAANFELNADGEIVVTMGTVTVGNAAYQAYEKIK